MHVKKHLSFTSLRKQLSARLYQIEDSRQQGKVEYSLHDCVMSGFAMMYFQDPSLLEFQRRMGEDGNRSNLRSMAFVEASGKSSLAARRETSLDSLDGMALSEFKALIRSLIQRGLERGGQ